MLLSVDDQVERIMNTLRLEGQLDNTYVIFLSDNGYFGGEHRIRQGKYLPHEPSSHVPMMIRGPGILPGQTSSTLVSNVDIASTIADIADADPTLQQDGRSLLPVRLRRPRRARPGRSCSRATPAPASTTTAPRPRRPRSTPPTRSG